MAQQNNPKLDGSEIIDCIPQRGNCSLARTCDCGIDCYFMHGWYESSYEPIIPSKEDAKGKIVRFNSGNDSNIEKKLVLEIAKNFDDFFFNTSLPNLDFPGPVVFTCNSKDTNKKATLLEAPNNLMFIRFRINLWNTELAQQAINYYGKCKVPIVLTFMRYYSKERIPLQFQEDYELKKSIIHNYYMINKVARNKIMESFKEDENIYQCGNYESSYCKDCGICKKFYYKTKERMKK